MRGELGRLRILWPELVEKDLWSTVSLSGVAERAQQAAQGFQHAFIIDRDFHRAAVYALAGAVLAFFGFIHGAKLGIGESAGVALGYLLFAFICWILAKRTQPATL